ncbi:uncharacterized protein LOC133174304 [Saccostrea echinata]|uniref:uncharacterized protein LOC133174304 n=1 Tax=Saccostrea echinata TaxID=191078 RepID=UPI002A83FFBE|nr:uncharacterized protein LOC133174304 [Saccostrea echinata]
MKLWILLLIFIPSCEAFVRCFSCSTTYDTRCGDAFAFTTTDASQCQGTCVKRRGTRDINGVRTVEITRGCIPQTTDDCHDGNYNGISVYICTCNSDYCNNAQGSKSSTSLILLLTVLPLLYKIMERW